MRGYKDERDYFYKIHGYELDLKNPKSFNEKVVYKKLFDRNSLLPLTADKYKARRYIKSRIKEAEKYLVPILYVTHIPEDIPFESLPKPYIIKVNHGCGWNIIIEDSLDKDVILHRLNKWLIIKYGVDRHEWAYSKIKPLIIVEKLLKDGRGNIPNDYRFWMFDSICKLISITSGKFNERKFTYYDASWDKLNVKRYEFETDNIDKPAKLDLMLDFAEKLSRDFDFVRIDFFVCDDNIYFSEITHYPASGMVVFEPADFDFKLGKYWKLRGYKK